MRASIKRVHQRHKTRISNALVNQSWNFSNYVRRFLLNDDVHLYVTHLYKGYYWMVEKYCGNINISWMISLVISYVRGGQRHPLGRWTNDAENSRENV